MTKLIKELDEINDFGFTAISSEELLNTSDHANTLKSIHDLVNPLIVNLLKDSDKEMIKWPNREKSLLQFQKKLKELTQQG